jgi:RNA polymerase sigma-70 factor, ECF subfamily
MQHETPSRPINTPDSSAFEAELLAALPRLRAISMMLTRDRTAADDLLQDALVIALKAKHRYELNTSIGAWMYRLMRNRMITLMRRNKAPTVSIDDPAALGLSTREAQPGHMLGVLMRRELAKLPPTQREAIVLVGAAGETYEDAAAMLGCTLGTIKSRVSRGREALRKAVEGDTPVGDRQTKRPAPTTQRRPAPEPAFHSVAE